MEDLKNHEKSVLAMLKLLYWFDLVPKDAHVPSLKYLDFLDKLYVRINN